MRTKPRAEAEAEAGPLDRVLYDSPLVRIGAFRAPVDHPRFHDSGPIEQHVFVFPRTSVIIGHHGSRPFVADPCTITFYNSGARYTREPVDPRGDLCEWFHVREDVLRQIIARHDPTVAQPGSSVFRFRHAASDVRSYAIQRMIVRHLLEADSPNPDLVEGAVFDVLERTASTVYEGAGPGGARAVASGGRASFLTRQVRAYLLERVGQPFTLGDVAQAVGASVSHLCRVFKRDLGITIHRYREDLRLRRALELIPGARGLSAVALELGYSSHSHLSSSFRRRFSMTPSRFRERMTGHQLRDLMARLV